MAGDAVYQGISGPRYAELKVEEEFTGNFFFETFGNKSAFELGWMFKLVLVNRLITVFLDKMVLYDIDFQALRKWAFYYNRLFSPNFPEKQQERHDQANDSLGRVVPIEVIADEVGLTFYTIGAPEWWRHGEIYRPKFPELL